ncbi:hypothetical protein DFH11DRAFT_607036 [Phellopilus nigrolimitatus]|nr:hypothetical protein DFH11DRAFT_607036 [Phellopilus nigrolimitatus]
MSVDGQEALLNIFRDMRIVNVIVTTTVGVYDVCIGLEFDYKYIWKSKWSWIKVCYLWLRYGVVLFQVFNLGSAFYSGSSLEVIIASWRISRYEFVMSVRTSALYGHSKWPRRLILSYFFSQCLVFLALAIEMMVTDQYTTLSSNDFFGEDEVFRLILMRFVAVFFTLAFAYELVQWIVSAFRLYQMGKPHMDNFGILRVLHRDTFGIYLLNVI